MFDLIRDSRTYDLGDTVWEESIRGPLSILVYQGIPLASEIASREESINKTISDAVAKMRNG